jgi:hypothetical protein
MNAKYLSKSFMFAVLAALSAVSTFAATSASLSLSGVVAPVTAITVTADPNASSLPVGSSVSGLKIASVNELSNDKAGYTVTLSTANGGMLKEAAGSDSLPYSLTYNGVAVSFSSGLATISDVSARTSGSGSTKELDMSFASAFLNADSYSDTLTFTIVAK